MTDMPSPTEITRGDIMPIADYTKERAERRKAMMPVKRERRIEGKGTCAPRHEDEGERGPDHVDRPPCFGINEDLYHHRHGQKRQRR